MGKKGQSVLYGVLALVLLLVSIVALVVSVLFWTSTVFDLTAFATILLKLVPTVLFLGAAVATVVFTRKFIKGLK